MKKEKKCGGLHITHGVLFQEEVEGETKRKNAQRSGKRTVSVFPLNLPKRKVRKKLFQCIKDDNRGGDVRIQSCFLNLGSLPKDCAWP